MNCGHGKKETNQQGGLRNEGVGLRTGHNAKILSATLHVKHIYYFNTYIHVSLGSSTEGLQVGLVHLLAGTNASVS